MVLKGLSLSKSISLKTVHANLGLLYKEKAFHKVMMVFESFSILSHGQFLQRLLIHSIGKSDYHSSNTVFLLRF